MRRTANVPRYRNHTRGYTFVRLSGKDIYLGQYGTKRSKLEYDRVVTEWLAHDRQLAREPESGVSVVELCAAYLKHAKVYYQGKVQTRILNALRLLKELYGPTLADEFGPLGLKAVRQKMIDRGASRRYCNDTASEVKRVFKWAAGEELVSHEVPARLANVAGLAKGRSAANEPHPIEPVPDAVVDATLCFLPPIVTDMVRLQRLTGARPGEICLLRPCDIDRTGTVWIATLNEHKTSHRGKTRQVAIGPRGQAILKPYLLRSADSYCFSPAEAVEQWQRQKRLNRKTKVQPSQQDRSKPSPKKTPGEHYTTESYRRAIHRACVKASVVKWSPNRIRHSTATEVRREFGLEAAQVLPGHGRADGVLPKS